MAVLKNPQRTLSPLSTVAVHVKRPIVIKKTIAIDQQRVLGMDDKILGIAERKVANSMGAPSYTIAHPK